MSTAAKSRWANEEQDAQDLAQRKQEKAERAKRREEKTRKAQEAAAATGQPAATDDLQPPSKRRKTETAAAGHEPRPEGALLLRFPSRTFGPGGNVEQYELLNSIEEGSYGMVSRAKDRSTGEIVALKRLKADHNNDGFPVTGLREIQTLRACQHVNVVKLREVVTSTNLRSTYLVMDFVEHDLKTLLEDMVEPFLPSETKTLMLQLTSATRYLHSNWILHRDLKTSNLLLSNRGDLKVADFGMARYTGNPPPRLTQLVVTLWYRSPELLLGTTEYGFEIDMWSVGCIFAELLTREPLFQGKNEVDQLSKIFKLLGTPTKETWPNFQSLPNAKALYPLMSKQAEPLTRGISSAQFPYLTEAGLRLLNSLLSLNPDDRPTASEALSHAYFKEGPRPKAKEMFPTFPSKAGQEKRRHRATPQAPGRGEAPRMGAQDFASVVSMFGQQGEEKGGGFSLRVG